MSMTIYVGNLPYAADKDEIIWLFSKFGHVDSVKMVKDRYTGRFRGFGFVEMSHDAGQTAISQLNGKEYSGRDLRVNEAKNSKPRQRRPKNYSNT